MKERLQRPESLAAIAVAMLIGLLRFITRGGTIWELDECLFALGVEHFKPLEHHPHPPGYPLTIALGKFANLFVDDAYLALVLVSIVSSAVGAAALTVAFARISGNLAAGVAGGLLFHLGPAMLVHGPLALSDGPALAFLSLAFLAASCETTRGAAMAGIWSSFAIGARPQYLLALAPALLLLFYLRKTKRSRAFLLLGFFVASLSWFVPLMIAVGGPLELFHYEFVQARYVAAHDAEISRSGWTAAALVQRFIAHPWGNKLLSLPLLLVAAVGAWRMLRERAALFLITTATAQLAVCLATADPADGVRYALPTVVLFSFWAGVGLQHVIGRPLLTLAAVLLFAVGAAFYVAPVLRPRMSGASPPVAVARAMKPLLLPATVVGYEAALKGHAEFLLKGANLMPLDRAMVWASRHDAPLVIFAEGAASDAVASAAWPDSDAYGKLTRDHYRIVSALSVAAEERFIPLSGVHAVEHTDAGIRWRWLGREAAIELPSLNASAVQLELGIAADADLETNVVTVIIGGTSRSVALARGERKRVTLPLQRGVNRVTIRSDRSVVPASKSELNNDPRELAVQLYSLRQLR